MVQSPPAPRVGDGGTTGSESSASAVSDASSQWCACYPDGAESGPADTRVIESVCRAAATDVADMTEQCARRIENLARLIEHVRLEKNSLVRDLPHVATGTSPPPLQPQSPARFPELAQEVQFAEPVASTPTQASATQTVDSPETCFQRQQTNPAAPRCKQPRCRASPRSPSPHQRSPHFQSSPPPASLSPVRSSPQRSTPRHASPKRVRKPRRLPLQRTPTPSQRTPTPSQRTPLQRTPTPSQRTPLQRTPTPSQRTPPQRSPPVRSPPQLSFQPPSSSQHSPTLRSPRQSPSSPPLQVCIPSTCPYPISVLQQCPCYPPSSPTRRVCVPSTCRGMTSSPPRSPPKEHASREPAAAGDDLDDEEPLWMFAPSAWDPAPDVIEKERPLASSRSKPPPSSWRPGVPYVEQHELSAIVEVDTSQSALTVADASQRRRRSRSRSASRSPSRSPSRSRSCSLSPPPDFSRGPRQNMQGLLIASHLAAQQMHPWEAADKCSPPPCGSPCVSPCVSPHRRSPPCVPLCSRSPPCVSPCVPPCVPRCSRCSRSPPCVPLCPRSPPCVSPRVCTPPCVSPCSRSPRCDAACSSPPCAHASPCPPHCPRAASYRLGGGANRPEEEDDSDIVAELIRRGVLRSPFSWMKTMPPGPQTDVDFDVSTLSGASSDFVGDLFPSGSCSTPRRAGASTNASGSPPEERRQRGGADELPATSQEVALQPADSLSWENTGATGEPLQEDLEGMFERLGLGWAASMLRKTQEAMAISSSSSETSRGAPRPGGGGPEGRGGMSMGTAVAGTSGFLRRGHSTPADASAASDGSDNRSWSRGQVVFTGDSDVSSVPGVSSRDLSTPSVSLVMKSKSKGDSRT